MQINNNFQFSFDTPHVNSYTHIINFCLLAYNILRGVKNLHMLARNSNVAK